jgi:hypothetical protein
MFKLPRLRNNRLKLAGWKILESFFNVQHFYAFDLTLTEQLPSTTHKLPENIAVHIFRWPTEFNLDQISAVMGQAGMAPEVVRERFQRGDLLATAVAGDELAAFTWTTFSRAWLAEARRFLPLSHNEAVQYDTLVMPRWRHQGLQYCVTLPVLRYLASLGYRRTLAWVNARNTLSIRDQLSQGKRRIATIVSSPLLGFTRLRELERSADEPTRQVSGTASAGTTAAQL